MKIAIISAMDSELDLFNQKLTDKKETKIAGLTFYETTLNKNEIITSISGIGKVNAAITTTLLIDHYHPDLIINTGIAGGGKNLHTKDLLLGTRLSYHDFDCMVFGYEYGQVPQMPLHYEADQEYLKKLQTTLEKLNIQYKLGEILSGDLFLSTTKNLKNALPETFAVEMEGASISQVCYKLKTPFISLRFISDVLDSEDHVKNFQEFEKEAAEISSNIAYELIKSL